MKEDKLSEQSLDFVVEIINLVKQLKNQKENIISNQIGRSGTSIGAFSVYTVDRAAKTVYNIGRITEVNV